MFCINSEDISGRHSLSISTLLYIRVPLFEHPKYDNSTTLHSHVGMVYENNMVWYMAYQNRDPQSRMDMVSNRVMYFWCTKKKKKNIFRYVMLEINGKHPINLIHKQKPGK